MTDIASLVFEIDSTQAVQAEKNLDRLAKTSERVEVSARKVRTASEQAGIGLGSSNTATDRATRSATQHAQALSQAERAMRGVIEVYGTAFNATGRYAMSQDAAAKMAIQNARAAQALASEQAKAAKAAAKAEADAAAVVAEAKRQQADIEQTLIERNAAFRAAAIIREVQDTERAAAAREKAAVEAASIEQALMERNAAFRASMIIKEEQDAERAAKARIEAAQEAASIEQTLAARNADFRAAAIIKESQAEAAASKTAADYAAKVDRLRATLDPMAAVQTTLAQRTKLLDDALRAGAITADQHAATLSQVTRAALSGVEGINKYSGGLRNGGQYATQFSYQLNDIVTGLVSGQKPMQVFTQQGGQVFQILQMAAVEAGGFKAAVRALYLEMAPLLATFGLWVAGLAAVGAGVYYLVNQHEKQAKALKELNAELVKQRQELESISPLILNSGHNADLAADGLKNFDQWLRTTNVSLAEQNRLLRENALNKLNDQAMKAAEEYSKAQKAFDKINKAGPAMASSGAPGGFAVVAPNQARDPKNNPFYKEAAENLRIAKQSYDAINDYRNKAYLAPVAAFGSQAASATKAAKAVRMVKEATDDYLRVAPIEESSLLKASNEIWPEAAVAAEAYKKQQEALSSATRDTIRTMADTVGPAVHLSGTIERLAVDFDRAAQKAYDIRYAVEGIGYAVKNNDWTGAFSGLFDVLDRVKQAFAQGASAADKFAAVSGVGQGIGSLIGGKTGSAISGAASGAQAGFTLGGPWGAALGAALGGLSGIFGSSAAKAEKKIDALNKSVEALRADNKSSSASIAGALQQANKAWNSDLEYSSAMVTSLRSIDSQIGSLATALGRSITAGNLLSTAGLGLGTTSSKGSGLFGLANILLGGSKTKTELLDQGLAFNPSTYADILANGVTGSTYADLVTTKTKKLLGVTTGVKVSNSTVTGAIDPALMSQISGIIQALGQGVLSAASVFGEEAAKSAEAALGSAVVDLGKLSLKDLKPDEIAAVLQATFDKVGDQLAAAGVPGLDKLAEVGEGAFETLTRLAREYQVVDVALASIGMTFKTVGVSSLEARDNLVQLLGGIDDFTSKTAFFAQNFLTDAERLAPVQAAVTKELARLGVSADLTRDQYKALVLAQNVSTESGAAMYAALLNLAPAFDKVAKSAEDARAAADAAAAEAIAKAQERQKQEAEDYARNVDTARQNLLEAYQREAAALQETADKYRGFAESLRSYQVGLLGARGVSDASIANRAELERVGALMRVGNADAFGQFQGVADNFLASSKETAATLEEYLSAQDEVARLAKEGERTATRTADIATQQLATLQAQVSGLVAINESVMTVAQAIDGLRAALVGGGVGSASGIGVGPGAFFNTDTAAAFLALSEAEQQARWDANLAEGMKWGAANGAPYGDVFGNLPHFATGGEMTIGGTGGTDSQFVPFMGTPGEVVSVRKGGDASQADILAALTEMNGRLARLERSGRETSRNTKDTRDVLKQVSDGGDSLRTVAA